MSDNSEYEATGDTDRGGIPRWAKLTLIIGAIVILIVLVLIFVGGGTHGGGPLRHTGLASDPPACGVLAVGPTGESTSLRSAADDRQ